LSFFSQILLASSMSMVL